MRPDVQAEIAALFPQVTTENLRSLTDFAGFQREFRNLFGFEVEGVDYEQPVETDLGSRSRLKNAASLRKNLGRSPTSPVNQHAPIPALVS